MSVDGFMGGPDGELDWMEWNWDDQLKQHVTDLTASVDTILLGRKMSDGFLSYWGGLLNDASHPEYDAAKSFMDKTKYVFSRTIFDLPAEKTFVLNGDLTEEVNRLKAEEGSDIIVYGGASFVSALLKARLIDELNLFINPVVIGNGISIFRDQEETIRFRLVQTKSFPCGIVLLQYAMK